jgi:cytoskeleton-associated protein 5
VKSTVGSLRRPSAAFAPAPKASGSIAAASVSTPFTTMNVEAKKARLGKDVTKWINEAGTTRKDLADALQHQMEPNASRELVAQLFSHDHNAVNDHITGLSAMYDLYSAAAAGDDKYGAVDDIQAVCLANFDLPLKYVSIKAHEPQSNLVTRCLDVVDAVVSFLRSINYSLNDPEAICWIPTLTFKVCTSTASAL